MELKRRKEEEKGIAGTKGADGGDGGHGEGGGDGGHGADGGRWGNGMVTLFNDLIVIHYRYRVFMYVWKVQGVPIIETVFIKGTWFTSITYTVIVY